MPLFDWSQPAPRLLDPTAAEEELAEWLTTHAACLPPVLTPEELSELLPDGKKEWADEFTYLAPYSRVRPAVLNGLSDYIHLYPENTPEPHLVCDYCAAVALYDDESAWDYAEDEAEDEAGIEACREWVEAQGQLGLVGAVTALGPRTCEACGQEAYDAPVVVLAAI